MTLNFIGLLNRGVIFSSSRNQQVKPYYVFTFPCEFTGSQQGSKQHCGDKGTSLGPSLQEVSVSKTEAGAGVMNKHCNR